MPPLSCIAHVIATFVILLGAGEVAAAQDAAEFYRGKTLNLTIGAAAGSDDDIYARLLAKYLSKHIAGNATVAVSAMPGSDGHVAAAYIYSSAAKDGTAIGAVSPEAIAEPLWFGPGKVRHDPTKFAYLGSASSESTECFVRSDTAVMSLRDALKDEVPMGAAVDGGPTRDGPILINAVLGTRFRVVPTYSGTADILAAIEKGEVSGACGLTWSSVSIRRPDWLAKGVLRALVQESIKGSAPATRLGVPLVVDFVRSAADREVLALVYAKQTFGRPYILPPGTPPERTAVLRKAFMDTLRDSDLVADAKRESIQINALPGEDVEALVRQLYATPPQIVDRVRAALAPKTK
jgi:tripartite-type tricarboxylate transporter receptor subunit TctC